MKVLLLGLLLACNIANSANSLSYEIFHSESSTYLHFLAAGFNEPFTSGSMKALIKKNKINEFKNKKNINKFKLIKSYLENGYNFESLKSRPNGFYGENAYLGLSVLNPKLKDFEKTLSIVMPYQGLVAYFDLKETLYSSFKKNIWEPTLESQMNEIKKINNILKKTDFIKNLEKAKKFYKSEYPSQIPFKIALIPIDDQRTKGRHTNSTNLKDIQIVSYVLNRGSKDSLEVVFHELCHALYEGQSKEVKKEIEDFYLTSDNKYAKFVYKYLNEALATSLGNGYYAEIVLGRLSEDSWYTVKYIDGLAKALYPTVKRYINDGKSLDNKFFDETLTIAQKSFPNAPFEIDTNMMSLNILSTHKKINAKDFASYLRQNFRVQSIKRSTPPKAEDWELIDGNDVSSTFIISDDKDEVLSRLKGYLNKNDLKQIISTNNFLVSFRHNGRYVFWINTKGEKYLKLGVEKLKKLKLLSKSFSFTKI